VVTEICVWFAARGLLALKKPVTIVTGAVKELRAEDAARALDEIRSLGGKVSTVADVCLD
jgi:nicotinamidase-related amidase